MSFSFSIFIPDKTSPSGMFGVRTVAIGSSFFFNVLIASSVMSFAPLVATITGSTTIFFALYSMSLSAIFSISPLADTIPIFTASG